MTTAAFIYCPACSVTREAEEECVNCGAPPESERLRQLEALDRAIDPFTIYARRERTTDEFALKNMSETQLKLLMFMDVVFYYDRACTRQCAIMPYWQSCPTKKSKTQTLNCTTYRLVWVD